MMICRERGSSMKGRNAIEAFGCPYKGELLHPLTSHTPSNNRLSWLKDNKGQSIRLPFIPFHSWYVLCAIYYVTCSIPNLHSFLAIIPFLKRNNPSIQPTTQIFLPSQNASRFHRCHCQPRGLHVRSRQPSCQPRSGHLLS
jgi:hypothetical protein